MIPQWFLIFILYNHPVSIPMADYKSCDMAKSILKEDSNYTGLHCVHTGYDK
jgi:hypothetical protein